MFSLQYNLFFYSGMIFCYFKIGKIEIYKKIIYYLKWIVRTKNYYFKFWKGKYFTATKIIFFFIFIMNKSNYLKFNNNEREHFFKKNQNMIILRSHKHIFKFF